MLSLYDFSIDYVKAPSLVRTSGLRFGWKLSSDRTDVLQSTYRIVISEGRKTVCDTGIVRSSEVCDIRIPELRLRSRTDYVFTVEVEDNSGEKASLTHTASTEILPHEWQDAVWIRPARPIIGWAPYLRTKFTAHSVKKAVLYASGLGCGEFYLNGKRTDDFYLDPPMTNYEKTVFYRRWDVTDLIRDGGNALAVLLGEGFYAQSRVWDYDGMRYGNECCIARLELFLEDGTRSSVVTAPETWECRYSPITVNNIYAGETYDCRLECPDFALYSSSSDGWMPVVRDETPKGVLTPCLMPPIQEIGALDAVSMHCASGKSDGAWIFDLGENFAGVAEFRIPWSPRGAVYVFRYAEALNEHGELDHRSTGAFATQCIEQDMYIARGDRGGEIYRPRLTYHGFRYVEVTGLHDFSDGYGTEPKLSMVRGIQLSTAFAKTSTFQSGYQPLDDFLGIMENTYRSNYHGMPEDCPAREKCGWLGDAQIVGNYGLLNYDSVSSYEKYLNDIRTSREVYGTWQMIAPGKRGCGEASPLWGCAQILLPYWMWRYAGDREAVLDNFDLMQAWVQHELARSDDFCITEGLGDWDPPEDNNGARRMPVPHSSTFMFYEICVRMEEVCRAFSVGDAEKYRTLAAQIKDAAIRHYYQADTHSYGYWGSDGVALMTGLYPDGEKEALLAALLARMEADDYAMPTGIYANKYLVPMLLEEGHGSEALRFLFNPAHSSFGTMLLDHATTVWECPDMKFVDTDRNHGVASYNHPMHGGFLYCVSTHIAGIQPLEPGCAVFAFRPYFVEELPHIVSTQETPYGAVSVVIDRTEEGHTCTVTVPAGAVCVLPDGSRVGSGVHSLTL